MKKLVELIERNREWALEVNEKDPDFFTSLSQQQAPDYLWIGCSDSRVPANQIVNLPPGTVFVHRNIANVVVHTDLNCLAVMQYAVEVLKVKDIIVCGHYGCGGVKAAMEDKDYGLLDNWLAHIRDVARFNAAKLVGISEEEKFKRLCEFNVIEQVKNVCKTNIIQQAWRDKADLTIHGWIYNIENGIIYDLEVSMNSIEQVTKRFGYL